MPRRRGPPEGMFRGLDVVTFRVNGFTEVKVALWTCVLFGLAHPTNLVSEGPKVLVTAAAGYFFYLTRGSPKGWWFPPCCTACGTSGRFPPNALAGLAAAGPGRPTWEPPGVRPI